MKYSFFWVFGVVAAERLFDLRRSRRNQRRLEAIGGKEFFPETFRYVAALHALFLASLLLESYPWRVPLDVFTAVCLVSLALLSGLRHWCISTLGDFWNVRIVVVPRAPVIRSGPYRFLRHPNYTAAALEFFFLCLLLRAPVTLAVFALPALAVLRQRIRLEEKALRENTDYSTAFP
ncbi:MAG: isoprenylcysteine carboxyl methyltransferase [Deltaproteobacteria bacterium]|nr:isoprenylcysteine carboxyl methyltransferase [Deltaproteobacteria bacterium]